jgi:membrane associated rhomboid family serine protease
MSTPLAELGILISGQLTRIGGAELSRTVEQITPPTLTQADYLHEAIPRVVSGAIAGLAAYSAIYMFRHPREDFQFKTIDAIGMTSLGILLGIIFGYVRATA